MTTRTFLKLAVAIAGCAVLGAASAADWPAREITLTVSYAAGGATDLTARALARRMEKELGVSVLVSNKTGAQGTLGQDFVRRSKPDGYNLAIVTSSSTAMSPYLVNNIYKPADFDYVGGIGLPRFGFAVRADAPYATAKELVEAARATPLFFGTSSAVIGMGFNDLSRKSGGKFEPINYKSGPETINAVIGGQVAALMQTSSEVAPFVQAGRIRVLGWASPGRSPAMPNVPTMREAGYDVVVESWLGLATPKGMPDEVLTKLQTLLRKIVTDPSMVAELDTLGLEATPLSGAQFGAKMQAVFIEAEPVMRTMAKP